MDRPELRADPAESNVLELIRPFDPLSEGAEAEYDAVVRRVNRIRARRARFQKELYSLEDQFVKNDLIVLSGNRRGLPLSPVVEDRG